jgi:hypothetical protein
MAVDRQAADAAIRRFIDLTDGLITLNNRAGRGALRELIRTLVTADQDMLRRLRAVMTIYGGPGAPLTSTSLIVLRAQVIEALQPVQDRLGSIVGAVAVGAMAVALGRTQGLFRALEEAFTGRRAGRAGLQAMQVEQLRTALEARYAASVEGYGVGVMRQTDRALMEGLQEGLTQGQMVGRLRAGRGPVSLRAVSIHPGANVRVGATTVPEGVFLRSRAHAIAIVRTETAEAQNATALDVARAEREEYPDVQKKILATFDERTAFDSIAVHGQVRPIDGLFVDGAGRRYLRPPARPNDREIVIPWRSDWPRTRATAPLSQESQQRMRQRNEAARARKRRKS